MNIKKSTFDYSPSLIEYEGNTIRINFDVEQIESENGMDSNKGKRTTRMAYAAYVVRIEQSLERGKVVDDLVESVVLHDVSFHLAWRRVFSSCHSSGRCRKSVLCLSFFFVLLLCLYSKPGKPSMSCDDRHFFCKIIG